MSPSAVTFALVACAYALGLCPSVYWLDSGELAGAGFELGVAHAPGHPLAALVEKLFMLLPIGDIALRAGLAQLFCGAGAAAMVTWLGKRVSALFVDGRSRASDLLGIAAGLLYASSFAAAFQAIRPEVYALSSLLVLATVALVWRYTDDGAPRFLAWAGLCFGLGLANHHYLVLVGVALPAIALVVPHARRPGFARTLGLAALATALGLLVYVYLPLRAAHHPLFDWGHPTSLRSFYWVVSAQSFQKAANGGAQGDLPLLLGALMDQLTPVAPLLALGGLYVLARRSLSLVIALALLFVGPVVGRLFVSFDAGNPDAFAYLGTGIAALALLCVPLVAVIAQVVKREAIVASTALLFVCVRVVMIAPSLSLARFGDTRAVFAPYLERAPPRALMVSSYFQTTFALDYLRVVEGARADLSYVPRHFLDQPGLRASIEQRDPSLSPIDMTPDALLHLTRPLVLEYDLDLDPRLIALSTTIPTPDLSAELQTRRFVTWEATLALHRLCHLGADAAQISAAEQTLRQLSPDDPFIGELLKICARPQ